MIVIADSGSTKTDWRIILPNGDVKEFTTKGLNPFFVNKDDYLEALTHFFPKEFDSTQVKKVFFYGAGCATKERSEVAIAGLQKFFQNSTICVYSDVFAAARAVFGNQSGITVILGTGTNVGYYNGSEVTSYTPSLGYAIGDEGSGAYLGKKILRSWLYSELPADLAILFEKQYGLNLSKVLHSLYSEPMPSRFLAGFMPFILEHKNHEFIANVIDKSFSKLVKRHIAKMPMFPTSPVGVVGSVGILFSQNLAKAIAGAGGIIVKTVQFPIDELCLYHSSNDL
jgi:N-acetylglucosamine kinase-like BadF-type ATPase